VRSRGEAESPQCFAPLTSAHFWFLQPFRQYLPCTSAHRTCLWQGTFAAACTPAPPPHWHPPILRCVRAGSTLLQRPQWHRLSLPLPTASALVVTREVPRNRSLGAGLPRERSARCRGATWHTMIGGGGGVIFFRLANCVFLERPFLSRAHSESMGCLHELIALHWRTVGPSLHCSQDAGGASNDTSASSSGTEPEVLSPHPADASSAAAASMTAAAVSATPQERGASATAMPPATPLPESARSHFHMHACAGSPHHTTPRDTLSAGPCALGRERNYFKQHRRPCQMKYWWKART